MQKHRHEEKINIKTHNMYQIAAASG